ELLTGGLVVRERGSGTRETLERGLAAVGERLPDHLPYLGSTAALKTAVQHAGAVAVLSSLAVADDVARGALVRVAVPGLELERRLRMVWKDGAALSPGARRIAVAAAAASHRQRVRRGRSGSSPRPVAHSSTRSASSPGRRSTSGKRRARTRAARPVGKGACSPVRPRTTSWPCTSTSVTPMAAKPPASDVP